MSGNMHLRHHPYIVPALYVQDSNLQLQELHGRKYLRRQTLENMVFFTSRMRGFRPATTLGPHTKPISV